VRLDLLNASFGVFIEFLRGLLWGFSFVIRHGGKGQWLPVFDIAGGRTHIREVPQPPF
jgi:hypothetical protein